MKTRILYGILLLPFFTPPTFFSIPVLDTLFSIAKVLDVMVILLYYAMHLLPCKRITFDQTGYSYTVFFMFAYTALVTVIRGGEVYASINYLLQISFLLLLLNMLMQKNMSALLDSLYYLFSVMILVHVYTVFSGRNFINAEGTPFFLGGDVYAIFYTFPMFGIMALRSQYKKGKPDDMDRYYIRAVIDKQHLSSYINCDDCSLEFSSDVLDFPVKGILQGRITYASLDRLWSTI